MIQVDNRIIIIGAGLSGIGTAILLKRAGINDFILVEKEEDIGGTWYTHNYPGVSPDIFSFNYAFSFEPYFKWSSLFAKGQDIYIYLRHCINRYHLSSHIHLNKTVKKAIYCSIHKTWTLYLNDQQKIKAQFLISASSIFNQANKPNIPGLERFKGSILFPQKWDELDAVDKKNVAVIGTGATGIQLIPKVAERARTLYIYQRSANWVLPKYNPAFSDSLQFLLQHTPFLYPIVKSFTHVLADFFYFGFLHDKNIPVINHFFQQLALKQLKQVHDHDTRKALTPNYRLGCRRPLLSSDYYPCFNQPHVKLITNKIKKINENSITTITHQTDKVDIIICATGYAFHQPGNFPGYPIIGLYDTELETYWRTHHYEAYSGIALPGFPNFFMTSGPYSLGFNWFAMTEANIIHIIRVIKSATRRSTREVMIKKEIHDNYHRRMLKKSKRTAFQHPSCLAINSYFQDPNGHTSLSSPYTASFRKWYARLVSLNAFQFD